MKKIIIVFSLLGLLFAYQSVDAQIIKKPKLKKPKIDLKKEGGKILDKVLNKEENTAPTPQRNPNETTTTASNSNKTTIAAPNVSTHLTNASASSTTTNYSTTRFEIQQAIIGVEIEIGKEVLASMPTSIQGMPYSPDQDEVISSGIGFIGLAMGRIYKGNDKWLKVAIMNNSMLHASYGGVLSNTGYAEGDETLKSVMVQGHKGYLSTKDEYGYELAILLGTSTVVLFESRNLSTE